MHSYVMCVLRRQRPYSFEMDHKKLFFMNILYRCMRGAYMVIFASGHLKVKMFCMFFLFKKKHVCLSMLSNLYYQQLYFKCNFETIIFMYMSSDTHFGIADVTQIINVSGFYQKYPSYCTLQLELSPTAKTNMRTKPCQ